ncbi:MAG TPA: STELLO glycosyltransferase family protein [Chitinophagaceae bacterium]|nr:STELLO glycosyltransferase family protein [Chitinophagaceae bacterium]
MEQRSLKKFIVITSIFKPTEAIEAFSKLKDYHLVVVGDKKTPGDWQHENCTFLNVAAQLDLASSLATVIPFNHYGRKMIGYVYAMKQGADIIIDTDDDNIPYDNWSFPSFEGGFLTTQENLGWVNIYHHFSDQPIWPRGLPLRNINDSRDKLQWQTGTLNHRVGIWQGLADDDPDVDAIYRLTSNKPCTFQKKEPLVLEKGTVSPFNSQNTAIQKELFPLLFLPSFVTFRFTDILRGIIAQPILWQHGYRLGFTGATVIQKRNEHDYFKDFESEVPMYLHTEKSLEAVSKNISGNTVKDSLHNAYEALLKINVVEEREMTVLEEWLKLF